MANVHYDRHAESKPHRQPRLLHKLYDENGSEGREGASSLPVLRELEQNVVAFPQEFVLSALILEATFLLRLVNQDR